LENVFFCPEGAFCHPALPPSPSPLIATPPRPAAPPRKERIPDDRVRTSGSGPPPRCENQQKTHKTQKYATGAPCHPPLPPVTKVTPACKKNALLRLCSHGPVRDPDPQDTPDFGGPRPDFYHRGGGPWCQNPPLGGPGPFPRKSFLGANFWNRNGAASRPRLSSRSGPQSRICVETGGPGGFWHQGPQPDDKNRAGALQNRAYQCGPLRSTR
jgi:hypothetical protein